MKLTVQQRVALERYVLDNCKSSMFGDGQEEDYINYGFPAFKGIRVMSDDELLNEAIGHSDADDVAAFLKSIDADQNYDVCVQVVRDYVIKVAAPSGEEAVRKVAVMSSDELERQGEYVDTHVMVDDEAEFSEK